MTRKKLLIFVTLCLLVSCSHVTPSENQSEINATSVEDTTKTQENKPLEKLSKPAEKIQLPEITKTGEFALVRNSEIKNEKGWMMPPYKYAKIKMQFDKEPHDAQKVTVIPLGVPLQPFQLDFEKISKVKNTSCSENYSEGRPEFNWVVELENITDKEILDIGARSNHPEQMPFSVFVIYPAVQFAKSLDRSAVSNINLPKSVPLKRVESVIDLDNDGKPDLLSASFCCGEPEKYDKCPYLCKKYYKKTGNIWELFYTEKEC